MITILLITAIGLGALALIWVLGRKGLSQIANSGSQFREDAMRELLETNKALREEQSKAEEQRTRAEQAELNRLVSPIRETMEKLDQRVEALDKDGKAARVEAKTLFDQASEQVRLLGQETANLNTALRKPQIRGSWGESQLRRCFEMAGMTEHVDFALQETLEGPDGQLRPDATVRLPQARTVVVDSKVPLEAFIDSINAEDEASKQAALTRLASGLRTHIKGLSSKEYQRQFSNDETPDFVVCFIRVESALQAALEADPGIYDFAIEKNVLITSPTLLIGLLRTIELGWRQEKVAAEAQAIAKEGRELHRRFGTFLELFAGVGKALDTARKRFNDAAASVQSRLAPQLRRFEELGAGSEKAFDAPPRVEGEIRELDAARLELEGEAPVEELPPPKRDAA
jgi:DNA recombination protein RmuC